MDNLNQFFILVLKYANVVSIYKLGNNIIYFCSTNKPYKFLKFRYNNYYVSILTLFCFTTI